MDVVEKYGLEIFGFLGPPQARDFLDQNLGDGRRFLNVEIAAALLDCTAATRDVLLGGLNPVRRPKVQAYLDDYTKERGAGPARKKLLQTIQWQARDTLVKRLGPWLDWLRVNHGIDIVPMLAKPDLIPNKFDRRRSCTISEEVGERYGVPLPPSAEQPPLNALTAGTEAILDFWYRHATYRHYLGPDRLEKMLPLVEDDYSRTLITLALDDTEDGAIAIIAANRRAALCATLDRRLRLIAVAVLLLTHREGNDRRRAMTLMAAAAGEWWREPPGPPSSEVSGDEARVSGDPVQPEDEVVVALHRITGKPVAEADRVKVDRWQSDDELITALLQIIETCDGTIMWIESRFKDFDPFFAWGLFGPYMGEDWRPNLTALDQRRSAIVGELDRNLRLIEIFCLGVRNNQFQLMLLRKACALLPTTVSPKSYAFDPDSPW